MFDGSEHVHKHMAKTHLQKVHLQSNEGLSHRAFVRKINFVSYSFMIIGTLIFDCISAHNKPFFCPINSSLPCILSQILTYSKVSDYICDFVA